MFLTLAALLFQVQADNWAAEINLFSIAIHQFDDIIENNVVNETGYDKYSVVCLVGVQNKKKEPMQKLLI